MDDEIPCYMVEAGEVTRESPTAGCWEEPNAKQLAPTDTAGSCPEGGVKNTIEVLATEETDLMPVTIQGSIEEQEIDALRRIITDQLGDTGKTSKLGHNGCIVRRSSVDGSLQKVVPRSPRQRILYL